MKTILLLALLTVGAADAKKPPHYAGCPWGGAPTAADLGGGVALDGFTYRIGKRKHIEALHGILVQCKAAAALPALMQWKAAKQQLAAHNRKVAAYGVKAGMRTAAGEDVTAEIEVKAKQFAMELEPLIAKVQERKAEFFAALYTTDAGS